MNRLHSNPLNSAFAEYGDAQFSPPSGPASPAIDVHRMVKTGDVPSGVDPTGLRDSLSDVKRWLGYAAESYNLSQNVEDYVLAPTLIFATEIPNANLCAFPFEEMSKWNVGAGCITYESWRRKPTFVEHANSDHTIARGVIFDSSMRRAPEFLGGLYRVVLLNAWDRQRDPELATQISHGRNGFSMGAWVEKYECSICTADVNRCNHGFGCDHIHPKFGPRIKEVGGQLVYRIARGVTGFECSSVKVPAYRAAMAEAIG